jgi:CubicO group peptidase (beta-lactamase class C family)
MRIRTFLVRAAACAATLALLVPPAARAQEPSPSAVPSPSAAPVVSDAKYADAVARIAHDAPEAMRRQRTPGMALALTDRTGTISVLTFGSANLERNEPVTPATRFGIGSITKSMTAIALLEARDRGAFDPRSPVTRYLPWFNVHTRWRPITGHDLLTHTSGLPDGGLGFGAPLDSVMLRDQWTGYAPGTHWTYSNVGYETLGAIAEAIDHRSWSTIVRDGVLAPLGMTSSDTDWTFDTLSRSATGYLPFADDRLPDPRHWTLVPAPAAVFVDPAGSVLSTPGDMARYARMILDGGVLDGKRIISPSSYAMLTHPAAKAGGNVPGLYQSYAYGLAVAKLDGDTVVGHTGGTTPYVACMEADLTTGFAAIALTNIGDIAERPCAIVEHSLRVLRASAHGKPLPALPAAPDLAQVKHAASLAGTYRTASGDAKLVVVAPQPDRLALVVGGAKHPLIPAGGAFWTDIPRYQYSGLRFIPNPVTHRAEQLVAEGRWYATAAYRGPKRFPHPRAWDAYVGFYRTGGGLGSRPYDLTTRVQLVKGALVLDDGTPLTPLANGAFRIGGAAWSPERLRFDTIIGGKAQRAFVSGTPLGRVPMP